ncbi:MAG: hypothetical protein ACWA5X_12170 [bacterium]
MSNVRNTILLFFASQSFLPALALAEILQLPAEKPGVVVLRDAPHRGETKAEVVQQYGDPLQRSTPVGHPPISSWKYPRFEVYFEGRHVIHSVATTTPVKTR